MHPFLFSKNRDADGFAQPHRHISTCLRSNRLVPTYRAVSTTDFNAAKPFSNWPPTILSQLMIKPMALPMKLFFPYIVHVTVVWSFSELKVNSDVLVAAKGFRNSSLKLIKASGRLSMIVMLPWPTLLLPAHLIMAPVPDAGPSKEFLASGSSFAHGDHASHFCNSFTWAKTAEAGAVIVVVRVTRKSDGCIAAVIRKMMTAIAIKMRIISSMACTPAI